MGLFGPSDRELMQWLKRNDETADKALRIIFRNYWPPLRKAWAKEGRDPEDTKDCFQHAVLELWRTAQALPKPQDWKIKAWLFTTAHNHWLNGRKKSKRLEEATEEIRFQFYEITDRDHAQQLVEVLEYVLRNLEKGCRQLLEAKYLDGLSGKDLARLLKFSNVNSVSNKTSRCLDHARSLARQKSIFVV